MPDAPKPAKLRASTCKPKLTTTERGYGYDHQKQRERLKAARPLCEWCGLDWSRELHHRDGNPFYRSDENAVLICTACHQRHHREKAG